MIHSCEGTLQRQAVKCLLCLEMHFNFVDLSSLQLVTVELSFLLLFSGVLEFHVCCFDKLIFQIHLKGESYNNKINLINSKHLSETCCLFLCREVTCL